ncbi:hypothetical protein [Scatolibacter rhodanostii]|uniref:hypothetical protein n=1 Tax=Scatolibacter rhodanostii TaxID=2014781 RepID=UPI000C083129|nr:hypothetical protein [Scatolibacter rhodanostii]
MKNVAHKTSSLLKELIFIAHISKTDFALFMNMTPSGLSKILTGNRLPVMKEKRFFSRQAGQYFSDLIFCQGCHFKFENTFPVIYDFTSQSELTAFLTAAIEYSLDCDYAFEINHSLEYHDKGSSFLGRKTILNMFCIILSDYVKNTRNEFLEFFSTLPLFESLFPDIFKRLIVFKFNKENLVLNQFFDIPTFESAHQNNIHIINTVINLQGALNTNYWETANKIEPTFLLVKGYCLLTFSSQLDGTPLMTFITHKSYLTVFFNHLMNLGAKKISYTREEGRLAIANSPNLLSELLATPVKAVYNLIPAGYLLKKEEIETLDASSVMNSGIFSLFQKISLDQTLFYISEDTLQHFCLSGNLSVPFVSTMHIPLDKRIDYLARLESLVDGVENHKVKILSSDSPKAAIFCFPQFSIVYTTSSDTSYEKVHYFCSDAIYNILQEELSEQDTSPIDFTPDLWKAYLEELSFSL